MWKRILEPWIWLCALADLLFSGVVASFLVYGLDWRYLDWLGISLVPHGEFQSIVAYTLFGSILWPAFGLIAWASIAEHLRNRKRSNRRKRLENTKPENCY